MIFRTLYIIINYRLEERQRLNNSRKFVWSKKRLSILLNIYKTVEGFFGEREKVEGFFGERENIEEFVPNLKKKTGVGKFCGTHGRGQTFSTKYSNSQTSRLHCSDEGEKLTIEFKHTSMFVCVRNAMSEGDEEWGRNKSPGCFSQCVNGW